MFFNSKSKRKKTYSYKKIRIECFRRIKKKKKEMSDSITPGNLWNWDDWASKNDCSYNKKFKFYKI
jgi:hypothetical protein